MEKKPKKKRGRKPKNSKITNENVPVIKKKKRGRKPKGGKIINKLPGKQTKIIDDKPNIILHLRCKNKDLVSIQKQFFTNQEYNPEVWNVESFDSTKTLNVYEFEKTNDTNIITNQTKSNLKKKEKKNIITESKKINAKLKTLALKLHNNEVSGKKSDCFWCTYYFDNPPIHIPARERYGIIEAYGCFCSPQCAAAYLKNEHIDSTTYWERYALLNNIYGRIFGKKNIKPAPNPFYVLDKYYGNLTIQEYRQILNNSQILMVMDKPLTKTFPELHEDNFETPPLFSSMHIKKDKMSSNKLRLKRTKPLASKTSVLHKTFNFS